MNTALRTALAILSASLLVTAPAQAQSDYPSQPIKLVVHTQPGAASDLFARAVGKSLGTALGQSVVVENRPGAGGSIGVSNVVKASPDGYTLLAGASSALVMQPILPNQKLSYDVNRDLIPIGAISRSPFILVASQASGIKSLPDLVAKAKANPGRVTFGSAGMGTNPHLLAELLSQLAGIEMTHVPYQGPGAAQTDLIGGNIDILFDTTSSALQHVKSGKTVAIAATGDQRFTDAPDVPTVAELGYPSLKLDGWMALYAPAGTPPEVLAKLRKGLQTAMRDPALRQLILANGNQFLDLYGDDVLAMQMGQQDFWRNVIQSRHIKLD